MPTNTVPKGSSSPAAADGQAGETVLLPIDEAERMCREKAGMSAAQFRHELAKHVLGNGGMAWVATATTIGVYRSAVEQLLLRRGTSFVEERDND